MARRKLLCVDDDSGIRKLYKDLFASYGYDVTLASSGREAIKKFLSHRVDAVVTDLEMPGMTGAELASKLKGLRPELPVVLVSGSKSATERLPEGVDVALAKGSPIDSLVDRIETMIALRSQRPARLHPARLIPLGSILASIALVAYALPKIWK
jgi:CheY-like chemotaxis protein